MTLAIIQGILAFTIAGCGVLLGFAGTISAYQRDPKDFEQFQSFKEMRKTDNVVGICFMSLAFLLVIAGLLTYAAQQ